MDLDPSLTTESVSIHISAISRHSWRGKSQSWKVCLYPPAQPSPAQPAPIMFIIYSKDPVKNNQNQENRKGLNIHILSFSICISKRTRNVKQNDNEQFQVWDPYIRAKKWYPMVVTTPCISQSSTLVSSFFSLTYWYGWAKDVLNCGSGGVKTRAILEVAIISGWWRWVDIFINHTYCPALTQTLQCSVL